MKTDQLINSEVQTLLRCLIQQSLALEEHVTEVLNDTEWKNATGRATS